MSMPGLTAEASLYRGSSAYPLRRRASAKSKAVVPQWCLPAGMCSKASRFCLSGYESPWCDILDACVACYD